jgi:hypothetical protein
MASKRRAPAAVAGLGAAVMVLFILPNPFNVPQTNPTATAEYAPVPGNSDDSAENANFGETGLANSSGIGAGGTGAGNLPGFLRPPPPEFKPRQKLCVGNPPRQTEDPLSPPCVPFFEGDNHGATFQGVTGKSIKVVMFNDLGVEGDMTQPWDPSDESTGTNPTLVRTIKAQLRYFQTRFQTYGRRVDLIAQDSTGSSCAQQQGDAALTETDFQPFAAVHLGDPKECYQHQLAVAYGTPSFGLSFDIKRAYYQEARPYIWGFMPDQETMVGWSAAFICKKLWQDGQGRAKFTSDENLKGKPRRFAMLTPERHWRGPDVEEEGKLMKKYLAEKCNLSEEPDIVFDTYTASSTTAPSGGREASTLMPRYKANDVTTIICYCIPVQSEVTVSQMQNTATSIDYFPEWYWDSASVMDKGMWQRVHGSKYQQSFGTSHYWRGKSFEEQYPFTSYVSMEPGTRPDMRWNFQIYHLLLNVFEAIQAAGPRLTPESVEQGMYTFQYLHPENPYVPSGGYGNYGRYATGDQTFIDTAMGWSWDPTGTPPGAQAGSGCIRPMYKGRRFFAETWPPGDEDIFTNPPQPCTQDLQTVTGPGP